MIDEDILNEVTITVKVGERASGVAPIEIDSKEEMELVNNVEDIVVTLEKEIEEKIKKFQGVQELLWEMRSAKIDIEDFRSTERLYIKSGKIAKDEIPHCKAFLRATGEEDETTGV